MPRGGKREGAGRPKGSEAPIKKMHRKKVMGALARNTSPLDYILGVIEDPKTYDDKRFMAAKEALPYVHPKLANITHSGDAENPVSYQIITSVDRIEEEAKTIEHRKQLELTAEPSDGRYN